MSTLELADVIGLIVLPLVTQENLEEWGRYSTANQAWYWEGMALQEAVYGAATTEIPEQYVDDEMTGLEEMFDGDIWRADEDGGTNGDFGPVLPTDPGPFFPTWQYARKYKEHHFLALKSRIVFLISSPFF